MTRSIAIFALAFAFFSNASSTEIQVASYSTNSDSSSARSSTLSVRKTLKGANLEWSIHPVADVMQINIQISEDGKSFNNLQVVKPGLLSLEDGWSGNRLMAFYRLEILWKNGVVSYTNNMMVAAATQNSYITLLTNPVADILRLRIAPNFPQNFSAEWRNEQGTLVETQTFKVSPGINNIQMVPPVQVTPGTYYLRVMSDDKKLRQLFRVLKQ